MKSGSKSVPSHYTSYLLRMWRVDGEARCRLLLENVATGERVGFDNLSDLPAFLEAQIPIEPKSLETFGGDDA